MYSCCFFGHRDTTIEVQPRLQRVLVDLIENKQVTKFLVGNQGGFDRIVRENLKFLKLKYPHIQYDVVLAYRPKVANDCEEYADTIYPFFCEKLHPRYAIDKRNRWLVDHTDYVVTYVKYPFGGAAKFKALSEKKGKRIIELCE